MLRSIASLRHFSQRKKGGFRGFPVSVFINSSSYSPHSTSGKWGKFNYSQFAGSGFPSSPLQSTVLRVDASISSVGLAEEQNASKTNGGLDFFKEMKLRFLNFKKHQYLKDLEHFQALAEVQLPKFMVIACVDSRVCPSNILGFQPGEAFMVRNVANLVPSFENGPTETNAALEFAVNTLEVENIFVIGHSNCAGIQALMSMQENKNSSFVEKWVGIAKTVRSKTEAETSGLSFDQQCKHCEKASIDNSLANLLSYPWIKERVRNEKLNIHGGYYDFVNCTFEKWTLDSHRFSPKAKELWC